MHTFRPLLSQSCLPLCAQSCADTHSDMNVCVERFWLLLAVLGLAIGGDPVGFTMINANILISPLDNRVGDDYCSMPIMS